MSKQFEIETIRKVFDNENGGYITVAPDADGLGIVAISDPEGGTIMMLPGHALAVAEAMIALANELA